MAFLFSFQVPRALWQSRDKRGGVGGSKAIYNFYHEGDVRFVNILFSEKVVIFFFAGNFLQCSSSIRFFPIFVLYLSMSFEKTQSTYLFYGR